ncbi:hypothetical protein AB0I54_46425 [Streptomyces sp. NPDC050625]|uniref:hypothetical protein n=1 Tax=Streptomyces sp. NPDC050625 TaxID=3154629 RepID=UPI003442040A
MTALVDAAARPLEQEIATAEATARAARLKLRDERSRLEEEVRRLSDEIDLLPPPTRTTVRTATLAEIDAEVARLEAAEVVIGQFIEAERSGQADDPVMAAEPAMRLMITCYRSRLRPARVPRPPPTPAPMTSNSA